MAELREPYVFVNEIYATRPVHHIAKNMPNPLRNELSSNGSIEKDLCPALGAFFAG